MDGMTQITAAGQRGKKMTEKMLIFVAGAMVGGTLGVMIMSCFQIARWFDGED